MFLTRVLYITNNDTYEISKDKITIKNKLIYCLIKIIKTPLQVTNCLL